MSHFKPRGLRIYRRKTGRRGLDGRSPAYELVALFKTTGRTGASVRSLFARASEDQRRCALDDWVKGHFTRALTPAPNNV